MKKLSKTQTQLLEKIQNTLEVVKKYSTYEEFFDNSKREQDTFVTGACCNGAFDTSEKYKSKDLEDFERMRKGFELAKNENTMIVFAKTETTTKLEQLGYIEVVKHAEYKGGAETIKLLKERG